MQDFSNTALAYFIRSFNVSSIGNDSLFSSFMRWDTIQIDNLDFDLSLVLAT